MNELDLIELILHETSAYVKAKYAGRTRLEVQEKNGANDLLTEVDVAVQNQIVNRIRNSFPTDAVIAEEEGLDQHPAAPPPRCWVVDPIDGTQNFLRGLFPAFAISIAFVREGEISAAGIAMPISQDSYLAERNCGATRNTQPLQVSSRGDLGRARVEVDFSVPEDREATLESLGQVIRAAGQLRCWGAATVALCAVAAAEAEAYVHVGLRPWDYAAGQLIVEEAGGTSSRLDGSPLGVFDDKQGLLVSNGGVHNALLTHLSGANELLRAPEPE
ncbi:MAG: inositol monophosphatase [Candidatus Hydrogenedentota bacterium]